MKKFPIGATIILCLAALSLYMGFVMLVTNADIGSLLVGMIISGILAVWGLNLLKNNLHIDRIQNETKEPKTIEIQHTERMEIIKEKKVIDPAEYQRKAKLCEVIIKEYNDLYKTISDADVIEEKIQILQECYRKLDVIQTTHHYNGCFRSVDEEIDQISKMAISVLNSYIKSEQEEGVDDHMIDIVQFEDDLAFISDWIFEKDERLNRVYTRNN